jgi:hypothetical protein
MAATVFFQSAGGQDVATLENVFSVSGTPADPAAVSCVVTDPTGASLTHTYNGASPSDITKAGTGDYVLQVGSTITGLWSFVWVGTGTASDIQPGTWTVWPSAGINQFYTSLEEVKDRLKISSSDSDMQLQAAVAAAARAVEKFTGRFFYQLAETRTFVPENIFELHFDDLVSITALNVDYDGDGVFETAWVNNIDYELAFGDGEYNQYASGEAKPYTMARVINGGGRWFPFVWPFARLDRVQIAGVWGWPEVPYAVKEAAQQITSEIFKLKDSPFGLAGSSEFGIVRVPKTNPYVAKLLSDYIDPRRRVGI